MPKIEFLIIRNWQKRRICHLKILKKIETELKHEFPKGGRISIPYTWTPVYRKRWFGQDSAV